MKKKRPHQERSERFDQRLSLLGGIVGNHESIAVRSFQGQSEPQRWERLLKWLECCEQPIRQWVKWWPKWRGEDDDDYPEDYIRAAKELKDAIESQNVQAIVFLSMRLGRIVKQMQLTLWEDDINEAKGRRQKLSEIGKSNEHYDSKKVLAFWNKQRSAGVMVKQADDATMAKFRGITAKTIQRYRRKAERI